MTLQVILQLGNMFVKVVIQTRQGFLKVSYNRKESILT
jgi:hypothetical protein